MGGVSLFQHQSEMEYVYHLFMTFLGDFFGKFVQFLLPVEESRNLQLSLAIWD